MKKAGTLIFVIIAIILTVVAIIYFVFKGKKNGKNGAGGSGAGNTSGVGYNNAGEAMGKDAYASRNGVKVYNPDMSLYKTASEDEWILKVTSSRFVHIPGTYDLNSNTWSSGDDLMAYVGSGGKIVSQNDVYLN